MNTLCRPMENDFNATLVASEFGLSEALSHAEIGKQGRGVFSMATTEATYLVKATTNGNWLTLYATVEQSLNAAGIRQARLYSRANGELLSSSGHAVYELLPGGSPDRLNRAQLHSMFRYLGRYNMALASIPCPAWLHALDDPWQQAASPAFLIDELPSRLDGMDLPPSAQRCAEDCVDFLAVHRNLIEHDQRQLIHGDIGPDNILFAGDDIVAIIDFTPHFGSVLYSVCQFFYWHSLFPSRSLDLGQLRESLTIYKAENPSFSVDDKTPKATMVQAAAFRLFGPVMASAAGLNTYDEEAIVRRADLLADTLSTSFETP